MGFFADLLLLRYMMEKISDLLGNQRVSVKHFRLPTSLPIRARHSVVLVGVSCRLLPPEGLRALHLGRAHRACCEFL